MTSSPNLSDEDLSWSDKINAIRLAMLAAADGGMPGWWHRHIFPFPILEEPPTIPVNNDF